MTPRRVPSATARVRAARLRVLPEARKPASNSHKRRRAGSRLLIGGRERGGWQSLGGEASWRMDGCTRAPGTRRLLCPLICSRLCSKIPSRWSRSGVKKGCLFGGLRRTPSVAGLRVLCSSVGARKRSSGALPPVGGAQPSQVAVGGTGAHLRRRRRRRLGSSQHLCVQKQVGKRGVRSSRSVFCCDSGSRQGLPGRSATPKVCVCVRVCVCVSKGA